LCFFLFLCCSQDNVLKAEVKCVLFLVVISEDEGGITYFMSIDQHCPRELFAEMEIYV